MTRDVRISVDDDLNAQLQKIQAFLELTTGNRPNKAELCITLMKEGIVRYQQIMNETIAA